MLGMSMADRTIHYEAAFEAFLRERGVPYVAVDEAKKALFASAKLKSFDFVVYSKSGPQPSPGCQGAANAQPIDAHRIRDLGHPARC